MALIKESVFNMLPRIKEAKPLADYKLYVLFDNGEKRIYDVEDDIKNISQFHELKDMPGLFNSFQLDSSRTCIVWNDQIDLPSDTVYEYGIQG